MFIHVTSSCCKGLQADLSAEWDFTYDDLDDAAYHIDADDHVITLNSYGLKPAAAMASTYFRPRIELALIESLRMARHHEWLDDVMTDFSPSSHVMINRVCEADVQAHKILTAWMARADTDNDGILWKHILCGADADMAMAFRTGLETLMAAGADDQQAMQKATAMAFNTWFAAPERIRVCDHHILNMMDDIMMNTAMRPGTAQLSSKMVACLTALNGTKDSYLDYHHQKDLVKNPYYTSIQDDINKTHLAHIIRDVKTHHAAGLVFQDGALAKRFAIIE